ncbi:Mitogen-activated protein kinase kinase kinase NPK1 [Platanthera guangdongensis]|uniref:Mitogen-activated protein kinase kinase kinase NPK1 n=1 Tax=Platanthera guangdongensis TaxID=2320717 RepID=A0ABR2LW94_9ASPA
MRRRRLTTAGGRREASGGRQVAGRQRRGAGGGRAAAADGGGRATGGGRRAGDGPEAGAREILSGLADHHGAGIIHCDVKPENVLIGSNGRAKIGDLGCARLIASGEREIRGSHMYMAPAAGRGEEQGMSADVWALGCAVIEMVTGRPRWLDVANAAEGIRRIGFTESAFLGCGSSQLYCSQHKTEVRWTI